MLVLSRREGEQIKIGRGITVSVLKLSGGRVKIGVDAPPDVVVMRQELRERLAGEELAGRCAELVGA